MRGRKPKPIERQIAEGDPRKHGKGKLDERLASQVKTSAGLPECPRHLRGRARWAWKVWSEELAVMKLDKRPDGQMLEGACSAYALAVLADVTIEKEGIFYDKKYIDTATGEVHILEKRKHPAVEIRNRAWLVMKAFCSEFGLSPVSRTRLSIEKKDDDAVDDLMKALTQPRGRAAISSLVQ